MRKKAPIYLENSKNRQYYKNKFSEYSRLLISAVGFDLFLILLFALNNL
jgi:hypothetical protein